jgi:putative transposase
MPSRAKKLDHAVAKLPSIPKELVAQFLTGPMTGEAINAAGIAFKQALIEASLNAELSHHLGYQPGAEKPEASTNHRNGVTAKTVLTGDGKMRIATPRDRDGSFEPLLLPPSRAHWCTLRVGGHEPYCGVVSANPSICRDGRRVLAVERPD